MKILENSEVEFDLSNLPTQLLLTFYQTGTEIGIKRLGIVGGAVRDNLLHSLGKEPLRAPPDIDIVIEGSAKDLAEALLLKLGEDRVEKCRFHTTYNTVEMKIDGTNFDLASARKETYKSPGQNPEVEVSHLENDLKRRDFTINAIAIELPTFNLVDPHEGKAALKEKRLCFLHSKSVEDDPTRVIRGARYAARLDLDLTPEDLHQVRSTIKKWPWDWKPGEPPKHAPPSLTTRLKMELELMLEKEPWEIALTHLKAWGALDLLDKSLEREQNLFRKILWGKRFGLPPLLILIAVASNSMALAERFLLPNQQTIALKESFEIQDWLNSHKVLEDLMKWRPSEWCIAIESKGWHPESIGLAISLGIKPWRPLLNWWGRWRHQKSPIKAQDLIKDGWLAGPKLGKELKRLRLIEIDKKYFYHS